MKRAYDVPKWLDQWNAARAGETNDVFEHVVPLGEQQRYTHIDIIDGLLCEHYTKQQRALTVPQLYYYLQRGGHISHTVRAQSMLVNYIAIGLQWGLIDWDHIQSTSMTSTSHVPATPSGWASDHVYVEVWVEKPGFEHMLQRTCSNFGVTLRVLNGRPSNIDVYSTVEHMRTYAQGRRVVIVYLCDLDPVAYTTRETIQSYLDVLGASDIKLHYAMLQEKQITDLELPTNPLSVTATGAQDYIDIYGTSQWELEALSPVEFASIVNGVLTYYAKQ